MTYYRETFLLKRIPLGIRAYGSWPIAGSRDDHSPFRTMRYWRYAIGSFHRTRDERRVTKHAYQLKSF